MSDDRIDALIQELKDLRLRETSLLQRIEEANRQRDDSATRDDDARGPAEYQPGDRVYVLSRIRKPVFAPSNWNGYSERRATVTRVDGEKVFFKTDNGTQTWRAAKNLRLLSP